MSKLRFSTEPEQLHLENYVKYGMYQQAMLRNLAKKHLLFIIVNKIASSGFLFLQLKRSFPLKPCPLNRSDAVITNGFSGISYSLTFVG